MRSSGYRAPCTLILEAASSISRRSSAVSTTETDPRFSSRRSSFGVGHDKYKRRTHGMIRLRRNWSNKVQNISSVSMQSGKPARRNLIVLDMLS